ncbi:cytochrome c oxidase assembly protein COX19 [Immersiella caudata]|uniref:Cytochrome c oxidase assembly protein COX19 n=1 Tax=Immersiella caudata TaxID=314043 RepID=A0AA40CCW0_9PEZI|nr:cytochrome c oxidase assembly protein COX19 [Immersiella caudata]
MSTFGAPGPLPSSKPVPPQRGSFPLDHDGECKNFMVPYLACIKKVKGVNEDQCRELAKAYLSCRMDRNLMAKDEMKNLGFAEEENKKPQPVGTKGGVKGELIW